MGENENTDHAECAAMLAEAERERDEARRRTVKELAQIECQSCAEGKARSTGVSPGPWYHSSGRCLADHLWQWLREQEGNE